MRGSILSNIGITYDQHTILRRQHKSHVRGVDGSSQMLGLTWYSPTRDRASRSGRDREGDHLGSPTLSQRIATVSNHRVFGREMGFLRDTASFSSSISSSRVPREVETSTEDPCTMVDKGCEDINVKAEMARQDEASIVHVAVRATAAYVQVATGTFLTSSGSAGPLSRDLLFFFSFFFFRFPLCCPDRWSMASRSTSASTSRVSFFGDILSDSHRVRREKTKSLISGHSSTTELDTLFWSPARTPYQSSINVAPGLYVMYVARRWNMRVKRGR